MQYQISVENIKCGGCARTVENTLNAIEGVNSVSVTVDTGLVEVETQDHIDRETLVEALQQKGYPEKGSLEGLKSVSAKAKSYVSCAIGRIDTMKDD